MRNKIIFFYTEIDPADAHRNYFNFNIFFFIVGDDLFIFRAILEYQVIFPLLIRTLIYSSPILIDFCGHVRKLRRFSLIRFNEKYHVIEYLRFYSFCFSDDLRSFYSRQSFSITGLHGILSVQVNKRIMERMAVGSLRKLHQIFSSFKTPYPIIVFTHFILK